MVRLCLVETQYIASRPGIQRTHCKAMTAPQLGRLQSWEREGLRPSHTLFVGRLGGVAAQPPHKDEYFGGLRPPSPIPRAESALLTASPAAHTRARLPAHRRFAR